jgi:hypothetical protein
MGHAKCQRHARSSVSTEGVEDPHDSSIGLHPPVTDCRGVPVAKRGMSVVTRSCSGRGAYPVDPYLAGHFDV